jgi:membrane protein DedA with SNARE-associated domain
VIESLIGRYGYLAILVGAFLEGETILVLGGLAAHRGLLWLPGVIACAFVGSLASDQLFFLIGRRHGARFVARRPRLQAGVARVQALVRRRATLLALTFRFLYGLRNVTPLALGMGEMPPWRFALCNVVGAGAWAVLVALLGWFVGSAAQQLIGHVERYELRVAAGIVAAGLALWAWRRWLRDAPA